MPINLLINSTYQTYWLLLFQVGPVCEVVNRTCSPDSLLTSLHLSLLRLIISVSQSLLLPYGNLTGLISVLLLPYGVLIPPHSNLITILINCHVNGMGNGMGYGHNYYGHHPSYTSAAVWPTGVLVQCILTYPNSLGPGFLPSGSDKWNNVERLQNSIYCTLKLLL